jgi:lysozyme family protein
MYTKKFEGGYNHDPDDAGGETFRGISRNNWPRWAGWPLIDKAKAAGAKTGDLIDARFADDTEMDVLVLDFYRDNFWRPFERLGLPGRLTGKLFDAGVNMGVGGASKLLQEAINSLINVGRPAVRLAEDGAIGPRTMALLHELLDLPEGQALLLAAFVTVQENYYRAIVKAKPSQKKWLNGWLKRAAWLPELPE